MTKENILKTAINEFSLYGYDAVSMNNLASKIKVNKATIYYHFKDKKTLYQEVLKQMLHFKDSKIEAILKSNICEKEMFYKYIELYIDGVSTYPQIVPLYLREFANMGIHIEKTLEKDINHEISYLIQILSKLNLKDEYKDIDPFFIQSFIMGTINTYYSLQLSNLELPQKRQFDKDTKKILRYVSENVSSILLSALCK